MDLAHILPPDCILAEMDARDHWPAIVELVDHLDRRDHLYPETRDRVLDLLHQQESSTVTVPGAHLAIPHATSAKLNHLVAIFGRSRAGIRFDATDRSPIHFVLLLLIPEQDERLHLQTLATIAETFSTTTTHQALAAAGDAAAIRRVLSRNPAQP